MLGLVLSNAGASGSLQAFAVSVDEIEKKTGLDFFPQLENTLEQSLESKVNLSGWRFWENSLGSSEASETASSKKNVF